MNYKELRKKYPKFIYEKYFWKISKNNLELFFDFRIEPDIFFIPKITIENVSPEIFRLSESDSDRFNLNNLIFHLGLMEIPSYWKATCSPEIEIRAGHLNSEQISFWKDLIIQGMGQFFYENKINFTRPNFLRIISKKTDSQRPALCKLKNRYLVPVGGGKDSIVTLELLKSKSASRSFPPSLSLGESSVKQKKEINGFLVNPTSAAKKVVRAAGIKNPIIIKRTIDPALLKLNQRGFLNGHTPFTAVLSFLSVFGAILFDYKNIVFSNEKSADEGNVKYLGEMINHQWSKSSEFERKFKNYCQKYLAKNINYFSLLRPYTELEISRMFLKYRQYFSVFSSCNVGQKMVSAGSPQARQRWCGQCPKCLFVYATLYPFLEKKMLLKIFDRDIFDASTRSAQEKKKLLSIMKGLIEQGSPKPFECVGTKKESLAAFYLSWQKNREQTSAKLPFLLRYFEEKILPKYPNLKEDLEYSSRSEGWRRTNVLRVPR